MAYINVPVTNTPTLIVGANTARQSIIITNNSSTVCYIGSDNNVTTSTGIQLNQNDVISDSDTGTKGYMGAFYGIIASGTSADIRYWERIEG